MAMTEDLRPIFVAANEIEARQVQDFLDACGIATALRPRRGRRKLFGLTFRGLEAIEVLVERIDEAHARELLARAEAGEFRLDEDVPPGSDPQS